VAATSLAEVLRGQPHPPIAARLGDHRLEQAAIGLLRISAPAELGLSLSQPGCERVAHSLEIRDVEHPRPADRSHRPFDPRSGEGRREQLAQPPLKQPDLGPQIMAHTALGESIRRSIAKQGVKGLGPRRR
jgi:hypothetical protein